MLRGVTTESVRRARRVGRLLAHATFANHDGGRFDGDGQHRTLEAEEIVTVLNQGRVGLCLSAVEGAMTACIEYLLCGVPIVSTTSRGGRDVFFDEVNALIVDDTPEAVRSGVETMAARQLDAEAVRERALVQVRRQRRTLQDVVQGIYDREGVGRRFADEWPGLITSDLLRFRTHDEILWALEDPARSPRGVVSSGDRGER